MTQAASSPIAPIPRRAIAYVIDAFIAAGLAIVLWGALVVVATLSGAEGMLTTLLIGAPIVSLVLLAWFVVYTSMQAGNGSIGMRAQGLRLVSASHGGGLGFGRTLLRNIIFVLASSIVVGYFTPLFDGSGRFQGWHDKVAGSLMLDARAATDSVVPSLAEPGSASPTAPEPSVPPSRSVLPPAVASATPAPSFPAPARTAVAAPAPSSSAPVEESSLIAFVPGISRDAPTPLAPAAPLPADGADLDSTVQGYA
ncbi:MAG: RDD family protein, partial [Microbacterium sp.]